MAEAIKRVTKKVVAKEAVEKPEASPSQKSSLRVDILGMDGKVVGTLELAEEVFGAKINPVLMAQAVRVYLANQRLGTASTKTRGDVSGGGKKPWRQKGTGRARTGSIRDPHWRGGGVVHGPHPKDFSLAMPKTMRRKALASALSDKFKNNDLVILEKIEFKEAKTKEASVLLKNLNLAGKHLIADANFAEKETKALRNLKETTLFKAVDLNTYEIMKTKKLVITKEGVSELEKLLTK